MEATAETDIGTFVEEAQAAIDDNVGLPAGYFLTWDGQFRLQQEANRRLAVVVPIMHRSSSSTSSSRCRAAWLRSGSPDRTSRFRRPLASSLSLASPWRMVLVTYLNQLVAEGRPVEEASVEGACLRLRPVLMTAATTALGLLPLLFSSGTGSEVQRPLATVVVGGLISSTILTLLVIPALYQWFSQGEGSRA